MPSLLDAIAEVADVNFQQHGYIVIRQLFDEAEMQEAREEADRLFQRRNLIAAENLRCRWQPHVETQVMVAQSP